MIAPHISVSNDEFMAMFHSGFIVDGRFGGLVVGRSHAAGNIYMIQPDGCGGFGVHSHLEGGEYLVSYAAWASNKSRLEEINNEQAPHSNLLNLVSTKIRTINTSAEPLDRLLLISYEGQFVINKWATAKYVEEINDINESCVSEFQCVWISQNT